MFYSFIIPVYNRPDEMQSLLECLAAQQLRTFEVIVVESGSEIRSENVVEAFKTQLDISYFYKSNEGQGFSRNYGMARAKGDYFIILDSDVLLDPDYVFQLDKALTEQWLDAFGGPDKLHPASSPIQKAVNYSLTSFFTTGGIRGNKKHVGKFFPRSFNMGFSRKVYEATQGFKIPFFGEDIELSARIMSLGFTTGLVVNAYVYHERKKTFLAFYKQMDFFGRARINIYTFFPDTLKLIHFVPAMFVLSLCWLVFSGFVFPVLFYTQLAVLALLCACIFIDACLLHKSMRIGFLAIIAFWVQMVGYGTGFIKDFVKRLIFRLPA